MDSASVTHPSASEQRIFCDVLQEEYSFEASAKVPRILARISDGIVGQYAAFSSPFGRKPVVYADWTASGRAVAAVEKYVSQQVLPFYANTHTTQSVTGLQSTCFRHEARQIIAQAVNAKITGKAACDVVLFSGFGTTSVVNKLVQILGLNVPVQREDPADLSGMPVVFVSSYEHHSNLLPWRESCAEVVAINYSPTTGVDLDDLRSKLRQYSDRRLKIGSFSACSNITGVLTDADAVSAVMHQHGGMVVFDYATAAPYVKVDMNPMQPDTYKDAIVMSGHKFLGGPGSPGILVIKKHLLMNPVPSDCGGGTVFYVTEDDHRFLSNKEEREEGGTPYVLGDIRAGLAFHLKAQLGDAMIEKLEFEAYHRFKAALCANPKIVLLGHEPAELNSKHLPVFSFLIRCNDRFLHFNYVCALLNDLFGIQTRGGCQCAGPFGQRILGISPADNRLLEAALLEKQEILRPGFTRLSVPYFLDDEEEKYLVAAVHFIADFGWLFLPWYKFNHVTGEWNHKSRFTRWPERRWLSRINFETGGEMTSTKQEDACDALCDVAVRLQQTWGVDSRAGLFERIMQAARCAASIAEKVIRGGKGAVQSAGVSQADLDGLNAALQPKAARSDQQSDVLDPNLGHEQLRWFVYPYEAYSLAAQENTVAPTVVGPLQPHPTDWMHKRERVDLPIEPAQSSYGLKKAKKLPSRPGNRMEPEQPLYTRDDFLQKFDATAEKATAAAATTASSSKPSARAKPTQTPTTATSAVAAAAAAADSKEREEGEKPMEMGEEKAEGIESKPEQQGALAAAPQMQLTAVPSSKPRAVPIPKKLLKTVGQAIQDWNMIEEGDRLCLGLSGGKDSLTLLHVLLHLQKKSPVKFHLAVATVDPETPSFDPSPLIPYVKSLGLTYHYLSDGIMARADNSLQGDSICAFCARFKRGLLYSCCRDNNYNKLVLAQHLDDLAESFIMSAFHNGQVRTMKANYKIEAGDVSVIRPLVYTREKATRDFAVEAKLPIINENCPACFEQPKERARVKKLLSKEESLFPEMFANMRKALTPLMDDSIYDTMRDVHARITGRRATTSKQKRRRNDAANDADADGDDDVENKADATTAAASSSSSGAGGSDEREEESKKKARADSNQQEVLCTDAYCIPCYELA